MTNFTYNIQAFRVKTSAGAADTETALGVTAAGIPILGLDLVSATSVGADGANVVIQVEDGAGNTVYLFGRTSAP